MRTMSRVILALAALLAACGDLTGPEEAPPAFTDLTTGGQHSCGLTGDGTAWCWGSGSEGQLGHGSRGSAAMPARVSAVVAFTEITAGQKHTCALDEDGQAWCWGWNAFYQRGNAFDPADAVPVRATGDQRFRSIDAGWHHTCALTDGGAAYCWGMNRFGQLGVGSLDTGIEPVPVTGGHTFRSISSGAWHTCGIATDDRTYCWGLNAEGQLGTSSDVLQSAEPERVAGGTVFLEVSAGVNHTCALRAGDRRAFCWGGNAHGQLGNGGAFQPGLSGAPTPAPVEGGNATFQSISAGVYMTCGVASAGLGFCWGRGLYGQLGNGRTADQYLPQGLARYNGDRLRFSAVSAAGDQHACGVSTERVPYCWGTGDSGQLGNVRHRFSTLPLRVTSP